MWKRVKKRCEKRVEKRCDKEECSTSTTKNRSNPTIGKGRALIYPAYRYHHVTPGILYPRHVAFALLPLFCCLRFYPIRDSLKHQRVQAKAIGEIQPVDHHHAAAPVFSTRARQDQTPPDRCFPTWINLFVSKEGKKAKTKTHKRARCCLEAAQKDGGGRQKQKDAELLPLLCSTDA
jgi:hypothetical protein